MSEYARQPRRATQFDREEDYGRSRGIVQHESQVPGRSHNGYYDTSPGDFLNAHLSGCSQTRAPPPRSTNPEPWMYEDQRGITKKVKHTIFGGRERSNIDAYQRAAMLDTLGQSNDYRRPVSPRHYERDAEEDQRRATAQQPPQKVRSPRKSREQYSSDSDSDDVQQERAPRRRTSSQKALPTQEPQQPLKSPRRARKSESDSDSDDDHQERAPRRRTSSQKAAQPVKSPRRSKISESDSPSDSDDQKDVAPRRKRRTSEKNATNGVTFAPVTNDTRKVPVLPIRKSALKQPQQQQVRSPREREPLHVEPVSPRHYQTDRSLAPGQTQVTYGPVKHPFQGMPHTDSDISFYNLEYRVYYDNEEVVRERCMRARATFNYLGILLEDDATGDFLDAIAVREVDSTREDHACGAWVIDVNKRSNKRPGDIIEYSIILFSNEVPQMQRAWRRVART